MAAASTIALLLAAAGAAGARPSPPDGPSPWAFPLPVRVPGQPKPRPYVPPKLIPEPAVAPADTQVVEVPPQAEVPVLVRPAAGMPMLGAAAEGARLPVRGAYDAESARGCAGKRWYELSPYGWVCSSWVRRTEAAPTTAPILEVGAGDLVPFRYVMVGLKTEKESIPLWASLDDLEAGMPPVQQLHKGDTVAVTDKRVKVGQASYFVAEDGKVLPTTSTFFLRKISPWSGVVLDDKTPLPFAWVTPDRAGVFDGPDAAARSVGEVGRRTRLPILEDRGEGRSRRVRVGEGRWMRAADLNEVRRTPRPDSTRGNDHWIDVDVGEQVLVAYEGDRPVFATLVSTGRSVPTPLGDYPIWAKVSRITMKNQPYEDHAYYVDRVPWALFFQAHNAIHAAYWHDRFGVSKSHGCINAAPRDARWLFDWLPPALPLGWSGTRTPNLLEGAVVHVRSSHRAIPIVQERSIGPPDRDLEKQRREEADARRLAASQAAAAAGRPEPLPPAVVAPTADPR